MIPRLRKKPRRKNEGDIPSHRAFIRKHECVVPGCLNTQIEAAHCRAGIPNDGRGGTGYKPHDKWCFPGCKKHHREQHQIGEPEFARKYGIDPIAVATELWKRSPARMRLSGVSRAPSPLNHIKEGH